MTKKFYLFPFQNKPSAIFHQTKVLQHFCTVMCAEVREGQGATVAACGRLRRGQLIDWETFLLITTTDPDLYPRLTASPAAGRPGKH